MNIGQMNSYSILVHYNNEANLHEQNQQKAEEILKQKPQDTLASMLLYNAVANKVKADYMANIYSRRVLIQNASYHLAALDVAFNLGTENTDSLDLQHEIAGALNFIDESLQVNFETSPDKIRNIRFDLIPLLYRDAQECKLDVLMPNESKEDLMNNPTFQAVKGMNFLKFYETKSGMMNTENKQQADSIIRDYVTPFLL